DAAALPPPAADQLFSGPGPPAGLQQLRFDDFAATTRFRTCLRIDDEAFPRIIAYLARIICDDEAREGIPDRRLLFRREASPSRPHRQPRHHREVEGGGNGRRKTLVALTHSEPSSPPDRPPQFLIIRLDVCGGSARGPGSQWVW